MVVETGQMSSAETGQMSAVETGQMSAAETGQMSAVETRQMLKSQIRGRAQNHRNGLRMVARSQESTQMNPTAVPGRLRQVPRPKTPQNRSETPDRPVHGRRSTAPDGGAPVQTGHRHMDT